MATFECRQIPDLKTEMYHKLIFLIFRNLLNLWGVAHLPQLSSHPIQNRP